MADQYDALAAKFGAVEQQTSAPVDYDALANKFGASEPMERGKIPPQELTFGERAVTAINDFLGGAVEKVAPYARGFVEGAADPVVGTAQLGANLIGQGEGINRAIAEKEAQGQTLGTSKIGRIAGNVLSPANLAIASRVSGVPSLMQAAGLGAASGMMQPVLNGDNFAAEKVQQGIIGAAAGGIGGALMKGVAGLISPKMTANQRLLADEGVTLTPGQLAGGAASRFEEKLTSTPFLGGAISEAREGGIEQFNRAALNRALAPIGQKTDKIGREGFQEVKQSIGKAYDDVLSQVNVTADQQFVANMANLRSMAQNLPKEQAEHFDRLLENLVLSRFTPAGKMSGETMKKVESELGRKASNYMRDASADVRDMGAALKETQNVLRQQVMRNNPAKATELQQINEAFANYARLRRASSSVGAEEGIFSPAQLLSAVKAEDKTVGKAGFAQGKAKLQDLAEAGKSVLGAKVPNSGTADRLAAQLNNPLAIPGMVGGAAVGIPASLLYSQPVQRLLNQMLMTQRGPGAQRLSDLIRAGATPAVIGMSGAIQ